MYVPSSPALTPSILFEPARGELPFPLSASGARFGYLERGLCHHLFRALALSPGQKVLAPDYHHGTEIQAIRAAGARVELYRVDRNLRIDLDDLFPRLNGDVRVLLVIHYLGFPAQLDALLEAARSRGILVVEDCALSLLAERDGVPVGTRGDFALFCLHKSLPVPNGGVLVQNGIRLQGLEALRLAPPSLVSVVGREFELGVARVRSRRAARALLALKRGVGLILDGAHVPRAAVGDAVFDPARADLAMSPSVHWILGRLDYAHIRARRLEHFRWLRDRLAGEVRGLELDESLGACPLFFPLLVADQAKAVEALLARGIEAVSFWRGGDRCVDSARSADALFLRRHLVELPIHQDLELVQLEYLREAALAPEVGALRETSRLRAQRETRTSASSGAAGTAAREGATTAHVASARERVEVRRVGGPLEIELLRGSVNVVLGLAPEWSRLADEGPADAPFYRPEWIRAYAAAFERGRELLLLTARNERGVLRGVLALVDTWDTFFGCPVRKLRSPANAHSSRFDVARGAGEEGELARALWARLAELTWDVLEIRDVPEGGLVDALLEVARSDGFPVGRWPSMCSPFVPLVDDCGTPLDPLEETSAKFRANLRRRTRNLEALGKLTFSRSDAPEALEAFYALERAGWKGASESAIVQDAATRGFYDAVASAFRDRGELTVYGMLLDGAPIAMQLGLTSRGRYYLLKPAYDERLHAHSPGQLLMEHVLLDASARGLREVDLLGARHPWKDAWTKHARPHAYAYVFRRGRFGSALATAKLRLAPIARRALADLRHGGSAAPEAS